MPYIIHDIRLHIEQDEDDLKKKVAKAIGVGENDILSYKIIKESIDARDKQDIFFHYTLETSLRDEKKKIKISRKAKVEKLADTKEMPLLKGSEIIHNRPVIIGAGPAGLFAGLILSKEGYRPILLERGKRVEDRDADVASFWEKGQLNINSNVQFGEGGAGTYSDGKLTTRIKDPRSSGVIRLLIEAGAPESIRYASKAHIGTDLLKTVVKNIRKTILQNGGEFFFDTQLQNILEGNNNTYTLKLSNGEAIKTNCVIMAIGHSARDTYGMLKDIGFPIISKPFAIGLRIEHSQNWLDSRQYGIYAGHPKLGPADYKLTYQDKETGRGVYTFCMCPGGFVVAAASEEGRLVTNGMSYHARAGVNCNSAVVVSVSLKDFDTQDPLAGVQFQRKWEQEAFILGGSDYKAPAQRLEDFLKDRITEQWGSIIPTYEPGISPSNLKKCLPSVVASALKNGVTNFNSKISGFADDDAILTGVETRTSSPIRIERGENLSVKGFNGIYAAGEGAGYAGGIISAAVDGIKVAESIIGRFKPLL